MSKQSQIQRHRYQQYAQIIFGFIFMFLFIAAFVIVGDNTLHMVNVRSNNTNGSVSSNTIKQNASCFNQIYDTIFVISIPQRIETLSITIFQLEQENMHFTVWEGHSSTNNYSMHLWYTFRTRLEQRMQRAPKTTLFKSKTNSVYHNKNAFFLRTTQLDIIRYAQHRNLSKILVFEDDILLANPYWLRMFCEIEPYLPEWYVLTLGQNEGGYAAGLPLKNIPHLDYFRYPIKWYHRVPHSFGAFALSVSFPMYAMYLNYFGVEEGNLRQKPLDNFPARVRYNLLGIHPPLILPDVTSSIMREKGDIDLDRMYRFMRDKTTDGNVSHFSKYWELRFGNHSKDLIKQYHFDDLVLNSPSKVYLHKR
eukprot:85308_1